MTCPVKPQVQQITALPGCCPGSRQAWVTQGPQLPVLKTLQKCCEAVTDIPSPEPLGAFWGCWWLCDTDVTAPGSSEQERSVLQTPSFRVGGSFSQRGKGWQGRRSWDVSPSRGHSVAVPPGPPPRPSATLPCSAPRCFLLLLGSLWAPRRTGSLFLPQQGRCGHAAGPAAIPLHSRLSFKPAFPACFQTERGGAGACLSSRQTLSCLD